jgi:hypothetical protein
MCADNPLAVSGIFSSDLCCKPDKEVVFEPVYPSDKRGGRGENHDEKTEQWDGTPI